VAATRAEHPKHAAIGVELTGSSRHDVRRDISSVILGDVHVEHRLVDRLRPIHACSPCWLPMSSGRIVIGHAALRWSWWHDHAGAPLLVV
jgi:hypothetical protein